MLLQLATWGLHGATEVMEVVFGLIELPYTLEFQVTQK